MVTLLVGRDQESAALEHAMDAAADSTLGVLLSGEPGIGKSALQAAFLDRARVRGALVLTCAGLPTASQDLPFAPAAQLLMGLRREHPVALREALTPGTAAVLADLVPDLVPGPATAIPEGRPNADTDAPGLRRSRLLMALAGLVEALAARQTLVLAVEDAHWLDGPTLALLETILRGTPPRGLLLVATAREGEMPAAVRRWVATEQSAGRLAVLRLAPLTRAETAAVLTGLGGDDELLGRADEVHRLSGGNPLLIRELARSRSAALPTSVREAVAVRFAGLTREGQRTVAAVAVAGRPVDHLLLSEVVGSGSVTEGVADAVDSGILVVTEGDRYRLSHEVVRSSVEDALLPAERIRHHAALAQALARRSGRADDAATLGEIAWHFERAGNAAETVHWARRAAEESERIGAFAAAHAHLVRLLSAAEEQASLGPQERIPLLVRAAAAAERASDQEAALAHLDAALAAADASVPDERISLIHGERSSVLIVFPRIDDAWAAAHEAMRWAGTDVSRAGALCRLAMLHHITGRSDQARPLAERALEMALAVPDPDLVVRAQLALADTHPVAEPPEPALQLYARAWEGAIELADPELIAVVGASLSDRYLTASRYAEAVDAVHDARLLLRRVADGLHWLDGLLAVNGMEALLALGRWDEAAVLLDEAVAVDRFGYATLARAQLRVSRGELDRGERDLEAVRHLQRRATPNEGLLFDETLVELRIWQRRPSEALDEVNALLAGLQPSSIRERCRWLSVLGLRAAADLAADARARGATEIVRRADADGRRLALLAEDILLGEPGLGGLARGELARLVDRPDPRIWAEAATTATLPLDRRAYANWRHAEALLETGAPRSRAEPVLRSAAELARRLGARGLEAEIEALALRGRISLTEASTGAEDAPAVPAGLTPRELEVLRLLGHGRTNREIARTLFMSEKTASVHVTHILRKLELRNRVQAAAVAVRLGLSTPHQPAPAAPAPSGRDP